MELNGVEQIVRCDMHVCSVQPVLGRVDSAAVDVSEQRNPVTSYKFVAHRDTCAKSSYCGCMIAVLIVSESVCKKIFTAWILALITQNASCGVRNAAH
jgi:hypothetical protein